MYTNDSCKCGEVHRCEHCVPEEYAKQLADQIDLPFYLVVLHKGHYLKSMTDGSHDGSSPALTALWHALLRLDESIM